MQKPEFRSTTVVCVQRDGKVAMAADGQVSLGQTVMKHHAKKIRRIYHDKVLAGFAGSAADGLTLCDRFAEKLQEFGGQLQRAAVELARDWRTDKVLRKLEAMLLVADQEHILIVSGTGDVLSPDEGITAIGSGGNYAQAAGLALLENTDLPAKEIAEKALKIAGDICIYTNDNITLETLGDEN